MNRFKSILKWISDHFRREKWIKQEILPGSELHKELMEIVDNNFFMSLANLLVVAREADRLLDAADTILENLSDSEFIATVEEQIYTRDLPYKTLIHNWGLKDEKTYRGEE